MVANLRKDFEYTRDSLRNFIIKRKLQIQMNTLNYINPSRTVCAVREESIENICIFCICIALFHISPLWG